MVKNFEDLFAADEDYDDKLYGVQVNHPVAGHVNYAEAGHVNQAEAGHVNHPDIGQLYVNYPIHLEEEVQPHHAVINRNQHSFTGITYKLLVMWSPVV